MKMNKWKNTLSTMKQRYLRWQIIRKRFNDTKYWWRSGKWQTCKTFEKDEVTYEIIRILIIIINNNNNDNKHTTDIKIKKIEK